MPASAGMTGRASRAAARLIISVRRTCDAAILSFMIATTSGGAVSGEPAPNGGATGLTAGSDRQPPDRLTNRLWVAESGGNKIAFLGFK